MIYLQLFASFFQIGLFSIGGGYAAMPLIQAQVVEKYAWLTMKDFTDLITIAEMTPGPIAINSATFVGIKIAGIGGALISTLGCILPSIVIVSLLAFLYYKYSNLSIVQGVLGGLRPAVVAMIASAGISILFTALWGTTEIVNVITNINFVAVALFVIALIVVRKFKVNPIFVMLGCGVAGMIIYLIFPALAK